MVSKYIIGVLFFLSLVNSQNLNFLSTEIQGTCMDQIKGLKAVADIIAYANGQDEMIFYGTKKLLESFPGLKEKCHLPLPIIDTSNWNFEKFDKIFVAYGCYQKTLVVAYDVIKCYSGAVLSCASAVVETKEIVTCVEELIKKVD